MLVWYNMTWHNNMIWTKWWNPPDFEFSPNGWDTLTHTKCHLKFSFLATHWNRRPKPTFGPATHRSRSLPLPNPELIHRSSGWIISFYRSVLLLLGTASSLLTYYLTLILLTSTLLWRKGGKISLILINSSFFSYVAILLQSLPCSHWLLIVIVDVIKVNIIHFDVFHTSSTNIISIN